MAAGKWKLYEPAKEYLADGTFDLDNAALGLTCALFLSTSNANTLSSGTYGALTNEHANGNGYTTGGIALTGETWSQTSGTATFDCDDVVFTASGGSITARFAVLYANATLNSVVKPLLAVCLLDTTPADVTVTTGNTLTIAMHASGVFTLSGASSD